MDTWKHTLSPPRHNGKLPLASILPDHLPLSPMAGLSLHSDMLPSLPTSGSSTLGRPPTPPQISTLGQGGVMSPPTPAPSPTPKTRWMYGELGDVGGDMEEGDSRAGNGGGRSGGMSGAGQLGETLRDRSKGKGREVFNHQDLLTSFRALNKLDRHQFLAALVRDLDLEEALFVSRRIEPKLRRDFLRELPTELALHCLSFVDTAQTLARAAQVSKCWSQLLSDEQPWKDMIDRHRFTGIQSPVTNRRTRAPSDVPATISLAGPASVPSTPAVPPPFPIKVKSLPKWQPPVEWDQLRTENFSFKQQFKTAYLTESNWLRGGRILASHTSQDSGVVTSLAIDGNYLVIGMANSHIHIFDGTTGAFCRSLAGHEAGVWTLVLVTPPAKPKAKVSPDSSVGSSARVKKPMPRSKAGGFRRASFNSDRYTANVPPTQGDSNTSTSQGGFGTNWLHRSGTTNGPGIVRPSTVMGITEEEPSRSSETGEGSDGMPIPRQSDVCNAARGWGDERALIVSGGCDRTLKVWDAATGKNLHVLRGHTSTVRCVKVLDGLPIAVSGSRDHTLRVWDLKAGELLRTLAGHEQSVRCIEVAGDKVASGSYDYTCRVWNIHTGACLHVLRGHYHQIYAVAFDGERVVTGSLDSTVRVWDANTGQCTALLQGHTSLVGQIQLNKNLLVTGGSDGRVIVFDVESETCLHRLCAHDNSVTCLQFDDRFIVSGGNDGRVKLWDVRTGAFIRELSKPGDAVWRVAFRDDRCVVLCQRGGKTVLEVLSFKPGDTRRIKPGASGVVYRGGSGGAASV